MLSSFSQVSLNQFSIVNICDREKRWLIHSAVLILWLLVDNLPPNSPSLKQGGALALYTALHTEHKLGEQHIYNLDAGSER